MKLEEVNFAHDTKVTSFESSNNSSEETEIKRNTDENETITKAVLDPVKKIWNFQKNIEGLESKDLDDSKEVKENELKDFLTLQDLLDALNETRPSVSKTELQKYKRIYEKFNNASTSSNDSRNKDNSDIPATGSRVSLA